MLSRMRAADAGAEASVVASVEAGTVPAIGTDAGPAVAPHFDHATLLANGHVLMPDKDVVHDWDPFAPVPFRKASLGDAGPAHTFTFAPLGGRSFVVAKADEEDNVRFELWDAERLVVIRSLGAAYAAEDPIVEFSEDGRRLMLLACAAPRNGKRTCEVGVHDLADGALVHRTKIPPLAVDRERVVGRISRTGKYFALSCEGMRTLAYDAETGREVYRNPDPVQAAIDDETRSEIFHFAFVDDRRLLTASPNGGVRLTDLATGRAMTRFASRAGGAGDDDSRVLIAPNRDRVATEITRRDGTFGVALFAFDVGSGHDLAVPRQVCPATCAMRWSGPSELVLSENVTPASLQLRVDAATENAVSEPYREPPPFDVFGVHPVLGDFDEYGTTKWHPENRSTKSPNGALVTPKGVRIDLASIDMQALMSAVGDRFFLDGLHGVRLFTADGASAELAIPPPP